MNPPPETVNGRTGVLAGGNFIVDHVKRLDRWPAEDSLARVLGESKHNGGGPYNLLQNLARLGAPFPLAAVGLVGDDEHGRWIHADCVAAGIDVAQLRPVADVATSYTDVMSVAATGRRTFFHQPGANARLAPEHFDFTRSGARYFYLGYLLLLEALDAPGGDGRPRAAEVLARARADGMTTVVDCVSDPGERWRSVVAPVLPEVDVLFANDFEAERLTGIAIAPSDPPPVRAMTAAARRLLELGVRALAIVHGPGGVAAVSAGGERHWQPALRVPPDEIAGTTGAGDALAAGTLYGLHESWPLPRALELGVCAAAASLRDASASGAVPRAAKALALGARWGLRAE